MKTADNRQHHYCFPHEITCVEWACAEFLIYTDDVCHYLHLGLWLSDLLCYKGNCFKQSINHYLYLGSNTCHQMKYGIFALSPQILFCRKTRWHCQKFTIIFLSQGVCLVEVKWPIILQSLQSDQVRLKETPLCLKAWEFKFIMDCLVHVTKRPAAPPCWLG